MKRIAIVLLPLLFAAHLGVAQDYKNLKNAQLATAEDCAQAEPKVQEVSAFLLTSPCRKDMNTLYCNDFLIDWLDKTDKYHFAVDAKFLKTVQAEVYLCSRYYAALAQTALNANFNISPHDLQVQAISEFVQYCTTKTNKVTINPKLQKYVDAYKKNTLATLIK